MTVPAPCFADGSELNSYRSVELPAITISSRNAFSLVGEFFAYLGVDPDEADLTLTARDTLTGYVFDIRLEGYKDDSLRGEVFRILVNRVGAIYYIDEAGVQYLCARGANTTTPQTKYCP